MIYLEGFLYTRCAVLWEKRHLPSVRTRPSPSPVNTNPAQYLGPTVFQLGWLFFLVVLNSIIFFGMTLLLGRTLWCLGLNMPTIEGWEVERHHAVLRRARASGGLLNGPDGKQVRIEHQEFPWDIGIWTNICQGMGSRNPLVWVWPFAWSPTIEQSLNIEHNCIDGTHRQTFASYVISRLMQL